MKTVRVSDTGGRYSKGIISSGVFTPEQLRYLEEELEKIVAVIASHDEALTTNYSAITGSTTLNASHEVVECTVSPTTITLPTAVGISGKTYIIINSSTGDVIVDGGGTETIHDELTQTIYADDTMDIISNGANWRIF